MTNNTDDFDQPEFDPNEQLPAQQGFRSNLGEMWRSKPLFKLVVLMIVVAALVAASVSFFSGGPAEVDTGTRLRPPPLIGEAPGGPTSGYMKQQTEMADKNRVENAIRTGDSAMPTPIGDVNRNDPFANQEKGDTELKELRATIERMQEEQKKRDVVQAQKAQQEAAQPPKQVEQFDDSLAQAMQRQMQQLTDGWRPAPVKVVSVVGPIDTSRTLAISTSADGQNAVIVNPAYTNPLTPQSTVVNKAIVPAGTVNYGQLLTEANSDVPGPILAQILSGPLSGARAVGQFQVSSGYAEYLVLRFNLVNFKGKDYQIDAIALDPDTTLGGMATEVDQRYFTRVVLPAAAGFLQGFGQALGQGSSSITSTGTTTIVSQSGQGIEQGAFQGLGQAANTASQFFQNQANLVKPLVRVAAGTPIGIFFVGSVQEPSLLNAQSPYAIGPNGQPLATPAGYATAATGPGGFQNPYPGTTIAGFGAQPQTQFYNPSAIGTYTPNNNAFATNPPTGGYPNLPGFGAPGFPSSPTPGLGTTPYGR